MTVTCSQIELASAYALRALPLTDVPAFETHLSSCEHCRGELEQFQPVLDAFVAWPVDVLRPSTSLQGRLADRIAAERGSAPLRPPPSGYREPEWEEVAPGIFCKVLANDPTRNRVSLLVRLLPGVAYPPHVHGGLEELHLLDGELWIDGRKLSPGDYSRAEAGSADQHVWSETGCTCVLLTSTEDLFG